MTFGGATSSPRGNRHFQRRWALVCRHPGGLDPGGRPGQDLPAPTDRVHTASRSSLRNCQVVRVFGPSGTSNELETWLVDAGMVA